MRENKKIHQRGSKKKQNLNYSLQRFLLLIQIFCAQLNLIINYDHFIGFGVQLFFCSLRLLNIYFDSIKSYFILGRFFFYRFSLYTSYILRFLHYIFIIYTLKTIEDGRYVYVKYILYLLKCTYLQKQNQQILIIHNTLKNMSRSILFLI